MNKRIVADFMEQAKSRVPAGLDTVEWIAKYNQIFAELIVRECVQTLRDNTPVLDENESVEDWNRGYIRAMLDCEHHIQEHFGVE